MAVLLRAAEERAEALLANRRPELQRLVDALIDQEVLDGTQVYEILGVPSPNTTSPRGVVTG